MISLSVLFSSKFDDFFVHFRTHQLERKQDAAKKYFDLNREVTTWLTDKERKRNQLHPVGRDLRTVQAQLSEVKVRGNIFQTLQFSRLFVRKNKLNKIAEALIVYN